jgi:hypothetical protein
MTFRERFNHRTAWHGVAAERAFDAPADPRRLVEVDPARIRRWNNEVDLHWGLGRVQAGNWDANEHCEPVRELVNYRGLRQRFEEGRDWDDTALYEAAASAFAAGESFRGYDSLAEFEAERLSYLDALHASIREEGYRPNRDATHDPASDGNDFEDAYVHHFEVLVVVRRDGEVCLTEGVHRFAIADLLGLDALPVEVLCRHADWQATRDKIAATPPSERRDVAGDHADHPDLRDVLH